MALWRDVGEAMTEALMWDFAGDLFDWLAERVPPGRCALVSHVRPDGTEEPMGVWVRPEDGSMPPLSGFHSVKESA